MMSPLSIVTICIGLIPIVIGEPPVQYGVPAFTGPSGSSGHGGYFATSSGHESNEGLFVDPQLLHKIKGILIDHEAQEEQFRHHGHGGGLSAGYSLSPVYGVPSQHHHYEQRVVGIDFGGVRPAIQVAQFHQVGHEQQHHSHHHHEHYAPSQGYLPPGNYLPPSPSYLPPTTSYLPPPPSAYGPPPSPRYHH